MNRLRRWCAWLLLMAAKALVWLARKITPKR
jgi:hypothetical protein